MRAYLQQTVKVCVATLQIRSTCVQKNICHCWELSSIVYNKFLNVPLYLCMKGTHRVLMRTIFSNQSFRMTTKVFLIFCSHFPMRVLCVAWQTALPRCQSKGIFLFFEKSYFISEPSSSHVYNRAQVCVIQCPFTFINNQSVADVGKIKQ